MRFSSRLAVMAVSIGLLSVVGITAFVAAEALGSSKAQVTQTKEVYSKPKTPPKSILLKAKKSVFMIITPQENEKIAGGTGFLITTPNLGTVIVTNKHVCDRTWGKLTGVYVVVHGEDMLIGRQLFKSTKTDLCLITPPAELPAGEPFKLAKRPLRPGQHLRVFGHPHLGPLTEAEGNFRGLIQNVWGMEEQEGRISVPLRGRTNVKVFPGSSGSPVINDSGEVVGVIYSREDETGFGSFIPASEVKRLIESAN